MTPEVSMSAAANFIAFFEGFASEAYWDVNHYRLGFGSDTEGPDQVSVVKGMVTTRPRALANLALRVPHFAATVQAQVGSAWDALGVNTKLALLSFAYNYGDLTPTLALNVIHGVGISAAIEARAVDNDGVNAKRRFAEAAMAASDGV